MWLVRPILLVWCLLLVALPAEAGTAEEPELSDPASDVTYSALTSDEHPYLDVTALWITPAVNGLITLSLQTVDNSALSSAPSDRHISCAMTLKFEKTEEDTATVTATYRIGGADTEVRSSATWKPDASGGGAGTANIEHNFTLSTEAPGQAHFQFDAPTFVGWGGNITYLGATCNRDIHAVLAVNNEHTRDRDEASAEVRLSTADYRYVKEPVKPKTTSAPSAPTATTDDAPAPAASSEPEAEVASEESPVALAPFLVVAFASLFATRRRR